MSASWRAFGGGPAKGEPELRRAVALFANDKPSGGAPVWGRVDAHIWLGIALAPGHVWVTRDLLPQLDAPRAR